MAEVCERCGLPVRGGAVLSPLKARIFDAVRRSGVSGISSEDLRRLIWQDVITSTCLRMHVFQINERLKRSGSDVRIKGRGAYRLVRL